MAIVFASPGVAGAALAFNRIARSFHDLAMRDEIASEYHGGW